MHPNLRWPILVLSAALALAGPGEDAPAFAPGTHAILTKAFSEDVDLALDDLEVRVGGEPIRQEAGEVVLELARYVTLADEYRDVREGRLLGLERGFERLSLEGRLILDGGQETHALRGESDLEGALVRFTWSEEEERFDRSFEEGGTGERAHLDALEAEADFLAFLPSGAVEPGATWDVPAEALGRAFAPSGDVRLIPATDGGSDFFGPHLLLGAGLVHLGQTEGEWKGRVEARYAGSDEVDGVSVGRIELTLDVESEAEATARLREALDRAGGEHPEVRSLRLAWSLEGQGELLWNLDAGHAHAFRVDGEVEVDGRLEWTETQGEHSFTLEGRYLLSGHTRFEMRLE